MNEEFFAAFIPSKQKAQPISIKSVYSCAIFRIFTLTFMFMLFLVNWSGHCIGGSVGSSTAATETAHLAS